MNIINNLFAIVVMSCKGDGHDDNTYCIVSLIQELLRSKQRVLEAASERGLLQKALLRSSNPPYGQVTGPYPNTDNQYPVDCGPLTKEQIEQVPSFENSMPFSWRGNVARFFRGGGGWGSS